ncbi:MAG: low molecular weight protein-tyrosine-phosphatase, partial [Planctomycetota bacterium]
MSSGPRRVLFVCLGNICRSPLAEGIFLHLASQRGVSGRFEIDSAGTGGWHVGNPADPRSIATAKKHGIKLPSRARVVSADETDVWDLVLAMDRQNQSDLIQLGFDGSTVRLMREFEPGAGDLDVP